MDRKELKRIIGWLINAHQKLKFDDKQVHQIRTLAGYIKQEYGKSDKVITSDMAQLLIDNNLSVDLQMTKYNEFSVIKIKVLRFMPELSKKYQYELEYGIPIINRDREYWNSNSISLITSPPI